MTHAAPAKRPRTGPAPIGDGAVGVHRNAKDRPALSEDGAVRWCGASERPTQGQWPDLPGAGLGVHRCDVFRHLVAAIKARLVVDGVACWNCDRPLVDRPGGTFCSRACEAEWHATDPWP